MNKNNFHKITVSEMAPHVHNFLPNENKTEKNVGIVCGASFGACASCDASDLDAHRIRRRLPLC